MSLSNKSGERSTDGRKQCVAQWRAIFRSYPPLRIGAGLLTAVIQQAQQESSLGATFRSLDKQLASSISSPSRHTGPTSTLRVGDRIVRGWGGINHEITIVSKGYAYRGDVYRSLSEIARLITGARWSGPRFFGTREKSI